MSKPSLPKKSRVGHQTVDHYQFVIDDTVSKVKGEFVQEGIAEDILDELRSLWETSLTKTRVCEVPEDEPEPEPQRAFVPHAYKQEPGPFLTHGLVAPPHMAPRQPQIPAPGQPAQPQVLQPNSQQAQANYMLYPHLQAAMQQQQLAAMQQQMAMQQHHHQQQQQQQPYMNPPGNWPIQGSAQFTPQQMHDYQQQMLSLAAAQARQSQLVHQQQQQQHGQYMQPQMAQQPIGYAMQPPPQMPTAPPPQTGASLAGQKRSLEDTGIVAATNPSKQLATGNNNNNNSTIPQQDGPADDGAAPTTSAPASTVAAGDDEDGIGPGDSGDELNEGDDLADVDDHEEIDEEAINDVMLGQFEKVHRSKAKWKVNLKDCVATINGVDYLLKKVTGEMNF